MQGNGAAAGFAFTGAVGHVQDLCHLPLRIRDHRPGQRGHFFGAEAGLHRQQKHHPVTRRIAGGLQITQNGPLLGRTDNFGLLALHGDPPVDRDALLIRELWVNRRML
jgi:hypothetical protein